MDINYVLFVVGLALIAFGCLLIAKQTQAAQTIVKVMGLEASSPFVGVIPLVIGAALLIPAGRDLGKKEDLRISNVALNLDGRTGPDALQLSARCPVSVTLTGTISVSGGAGTVTYRFLRKEGAFGEETPTQVETVSFGSPGSATVQDVVAVTPPEGTFYVADVLEVVDPGGRRSNSVGFTVTCSQSTEPPPPGIPPPPDIPAPGQ